MLSDFWHTFCRGHPRRARTMARAKTPFLFVQTVDVGRTNAKCRPRDRVGRGRKSVSALENASLSFLSAIDTEGGLDAVLFLRRTGSVLASWTRDGIRLDVVSVMAATMLASVDTIIEALGGPSSR